jgi:hypothetical protein
MSCPERLKALADTRTNLIAQLRELNFLRERLGKAQLRSTQRSRPKSRRKEREFRTVKAASVGSDSRKPAGESGS